MSELSIIPMVMVVFVLPMLIIIWCKFDLWYQKRNDWYWVSKEVYLENERIRLENKVCQL